MPGDFPGESRTLLRTRLDADPLHAGAQPLIRIVVPGRVYRQDDLDLTHTPAFGQIEGLVVGEGSRSPTSRTLLAFAHQMFSPASDPVPPELFPYFEPSAEIDLSCWQCDGASCRVQEDRVD
jgi:phenylalanyl-tRNA synthetase alpha chain